MAELADARDSKSLGRKPVRVRFPPRAPTLLAETAKVAAVVKMKRAFTESRQKQPLPKNGLQSCNKFLLNAGRKLDMNELNVINFGIENE